MLGATSEKARQYVNSTASFRASGNNADGPRNSFASTCHATMISRNSSRCGNSVEVRAGAWLSGRQTPNI